MNISGAKFENHYTNIFGDILDSVFCCLCGTIYFSLSSFMSFAKYKHVNISKTSKRQFSVDKGKLTAIASWKMTFRASDQSALLSVCEAAGEESGSNVFAFTAMT